MIPIRYSAGSLTCYAGNRRAVPIWPLALAIAFPLALVAIWCGPFDLAFIGGLPLLLAWGLAGLIALIVAVDAARNRAWRRMIWALVLPVTTAFAFLNFETVWGLAITTGEYIHFRAMRAHYLADIAKLPKDGPRLMIFDWGGFGVSHAVVYDESDEIALPEGKQSAAWKNRIAQTELSCGVWGSSVGGHFYIVRIGC